jgi:tetratricopeptide (TPR) repeat protein
MEFAHWAGQPEHAALDAFCVAEMPAQILRERQEAVRKLLGERGEWEAFRAGLFEIGASLRKRYAWARALAWWEMAARLAEVSGEVALVDRSYALTELGDVSLLVGHTAEALNSFRDGLAIADRLAKSDPGNAGWQRDLSVSFNNIGDVLVAQGNLPEALNSFRDGLAIADRLAKSDPGNAGWQRDLIVSHVKISEAVPGEAKVMLTQALAIASRLRDEGRLAPRDGWMPDELSRRLAALGN